MQNLFDLSGKTVLITGASGGLGRAIAETMSAQGATIIVSDLNADQCNSVVNDLSLQGGTAHSRPCDLSNHHALNSLIESLLHDFSSIDVLICNAGVQGPAGSLQNIDELAWQQVMDINLKSAMQLSNALAPRMAEQGGGSIILMSSIAGLRGNKSIGLYGMSKAALAQLARNLAVEWGPSGIRVNSISPGLIRTPFAEELIANTEFMQRRLGVTPLRRVGEPEEIAGVAVMLASRAGGFITGQNLVVDGGTLITDGS